MNSAPSPIVIPPALQRRTLLCAGASLSAWPLATCLAAPPLTRAPLALNERTNRDFVLPFLETLARGAGLQWEMHFVPSGRLLMMATQGQALAFGLGRTAARESQLSFSKPLFSSRLWMATRKERPGRVEQLSDLAGLTVCIKRNFSYGTEFDEARERGVFKVAVSDSDESARLQMMQLGRCDVMAVVHRSSDPQMVARRLQVQTGQGTALTVGERPLASDPVFIAAQRNGPLAGILPRINQGLQSERAALDAFVNSSA